MEENKTRTMTDNDRKGLAAAFQHFMKEMDGRTTTQETCLACINEALDAGLTTDEILNPANYYRAAREVEKPDAAAYIRLMTDSAIAVRPLKSDEGWDSQMTAQLTSRCMREFYTASHKAGGEWNTQTAIENLTRLVRRSTLQAVMDDSLIGRVEEKGDYGANTNVYQYIQQLIWHHEDFGMNETLTEAQAERDRNIRDTLGEESEDPTGHDARTADGWPVYLNGEPRPQTEEEENVTGEDGAGSESDEREAYISMLTPDAFKAGKVREAFMSLSLGELTAVTTLAPPETTLEDFITLLCEGRCDTSDESPETRDAHQHLNEKLYGSYRECLSWQNIDADGAAALHADYLTVSWDMRDEGTRRLQKMRDLVYASHREDDPDIMAVLAEIEKKYGR